MRKGQPMPENAKKIISMKIKKLHKEGKMEKSHCFKKGQPAWNKGRYMRISPATEFTSETKGMVHPSWGGGIQTSKRDGVYLWVGPKKRIRRSHFVYTEAYGQIPKGYIIYHNNGDKFDDSPENLEAISRAELLRRNRFLK